MDDSDSEKKQLIEDLRAAIAARDEFIAIAAHELRNPMTPLVAQVQLLRSRAERENVSPAFLKNLDNLQLAVEHYLLRATTLLEISRLNAGRLRLQVSSFDLCELVRECARKQEILAAYAGSTLELRLPARMAGTWDRLAIEQVVDNLLSNAVRYGDGKPIRIDLKDNGSQSEIHVIDQGIGIAAEDRERIFQRFERAVGGGTSGGFGIGLWLAYQLVLAHGGTLDVQSELGLGSRFIVRLPRVVGPEDGASEQAAQ